MYISMPDTSYMYEVLVMHRCICVFLMSTKERMLSSKNQYALTRSIESQDELSQQLGVRKILKHVYDWIDRCIPLNSFY